MDNNRYLDSDSVRSSFGLVECNITEKRSHAVESCSHLCFFLNLKFLQPFGLKSADELVSKYGFFQQKVYDEIVEKLSILPKKKKRGLFVMDGNKKLSLRDFKLMEKDGRKVLLSCKPKCIVKQVIRVNDAHETLYDFYLRWDERDVVLDHKNRKFATYLEHHLVGNDFRGLVEDTDIWTNIVNRYEGMFDCGLGSVCV